MWGADVTARHSFRTHYSALSSIMGCADMPHRAAMPRLPLLCQNDVICEFHSQKTMELILVVVISAGMAGNSQNGVSRSLKVLWVAMLD